LTSLERLLLWAETINVKVEQKVVGFYLAKDDLSDDDREYFEDLKVDVTDRE